MNLYELRDRVRSILMIPVVMWVMLWLLEGSREANALLPYTAGFALVLIVVVVAGRVFEHLTAGWLPQALTQANRVTTALLYAAVLLIILQAAVRLARTMLTPAAAQPVSNSTERIGVLNVETTRPRNTAGADQSLDLEEPDQVR